MKTLTRTASSLALALTLTFAAACAPTETPSTTPETATASDATQTSSPTDTPSTTDEPLKVGIVQFVENGAFDDMRNGFIDTLRETYSEDQLEIVFENAQADPSTMNSIVRSMNDGTFDLVTTIATPPSQAFVNLGSETPNLFIAMSDPIGSGVLSSFENPDKNSTGTSNPIPIEGIFEVAQTLTPDATRFGFLYSTNEDNSLNTVNKAKAHLDTLGLTYQDATVSNSSEVQQVVDSLLPEVDALFIPNDSIIQNAMPIVVDAATRAGVPVYGSSAVMVDAGAIASVAIADRDMGVKSAELALEILGGKTPAEVPALAVEGDVLDLNTASAEALGIEIPESLLQDAVIHD